VAGPHGPATRACAGVHVAASPRPWAPRRSRPSRRVQPASWRPGLLRLWTDGHSAVEHLCVLSSSAERDVSKREKQSIFSFPNLRRKFVSACAFISNKTLCFGNDRSQPNGGASLVVVSRHRTGDDLGRNVRRMHGRARRGAPRSPAGGGYGYGLLRSSSRAPVTTTHATHVNPGDLITHSQINGIYKQYHRRDTSLHSHGRPCIARRPRLTRDTACSLARKLS